MLINSNYLKLKDSYLFSTIAKKVEAYSAANPDKKIIRLGIGDVTLPLCRSAVEAMRAAALEQGAAETFRGYGPEQGYAFLREAIRGYYSGNGVELAADEIFVSDGAKSDVANILDLFDKGNRVLIPNPVYPVYLDTNIMDGREIVYIDANEQNGFLPLPDETQKADIIYLCSPNNPTGGAYDRLQLKAWVDYANKNGAIILYDAAYEAFVSSADIPRSIMEIEGARTCAIEFNSLSKTAGFTGVRCGYTIVPHELIRQDTSIRKLWLRRQTTKFNGVSYVVQRGAEAVFSADGLAEISKNIDYYRGNAKVIADALTRAGVWFTGGVHSPYIFLKCPGGMDSWAFFDMLLEKAGVVGTPGSGFGSGGEGFFRLTAFGSSANTLEAVERIARVLK